MSSHKYVPLILDIGSRYIQAGIAGEAQPSVLIYTSLPNVNGVSIDQFPPLFEINEYALDKDQKEELYGRLRKNEHYDRLSKLYSTEVHNWLDMSDEVTLQIKLDQVFSELVLNPRSCKVVVIDRDFSALTKMKVLNVLINKVNIKSAIFQPEPILSVIGANVDNGIVINLDWDHATVYSVIDLRVTSIKELPQRYTGMGLHYLIVLKLIESGNDLINDANMFDIIQELISKMYLAGYKPEHYEEYASSIPIDLFHVLFQELYFQESTIYDTVESLINKAQIDSRKLLLENVIFTGEITKIPGFKLKFLEILQKRLAVQGTFTLGSWSGCSLYISTKLIHNGTKWDEMQYTRESILKYISSDTYKLAAIDN